MNQTQHGSMRTIPAFSSPACAFGVLLTLCVFGSAANGQAGAADLEAAEAPNVGTPMAGERVDLSLHEPSIIESMDEVMARQAAMPIGPEPLKRGHRGEPGRWQVPSRKLTYRAHSGEHYATVTWGDPKISIGFSEVVNLQGAWVMGQGASNAWATQLVAVGYRAGHEVTRSQPFVHLRVEPRWFAMNLVGVDQVIFEAAPSSNGHAYFGLDDLTFHSVANDSTTTLTFDDLPWRHDLTGSNYGGLHWGEGSGEFLGVGVVPAPQVPPGSNARLGTGSTSRPPSPSFSGGGGTSPSPGTGFSGPRMSDPGASWVPPDTCGAAGPDHFVTVVNQNISVYDKQTGQRLVNTSLQNFFNVGGPAADPRVHYDHYEDRWIVIAADFDAGVYFAYSTTEDPTGNWFKTFLPLAKGSDLGTLPDYPTLGFDEDGIYLSAYMFGNNFLMSLFAIDKAPLLSASPSVGTLTAWRQLPWEGAIQPCATYGGSGPLYAVSRFSSTQLRLRRIDGPLTNPSLTEMGFVDVPFGGTPPSVPALGSNPDLSAVGPRPMNAVYRLGSVWTAHSVDVNGRAAVRWYEIDVATVSTKQVGTIEDPVFHYFFPSIAVTGSGAVGLGFSASHANIYPSAYFCGRVHTDPPGETSSPAIVKLGSGPYNGGGSPQRWGDYSLTTVDPVDDSLWTTQAVSDGSWAVWVVQLIFPVIYPEPFSYCAGKPNSVGFSPVVSFTGTSAFSSQPTTLFCDHQLPFKNGLSFWGVGQATIPFLSGTLCTNPPLRRGPIILSDGLGLSTYPLNFLLEDVGSMRNYQWWYRDPAVGDGTGAGLSNALEIVIAP